MSEQEKSLAFSATGGVQITNTAEAASFAKSLMREGLVPSSLKTPGQVVIALQAGAEVGLRPMQSLRYVAPINGNPTIWGEGAKGLVLATGQVESWRDWWQDGDVELTVEPTSYPDSLVAVTRLSRKGGGEVTRQFSVADAKRARLWGKRGPWSEYPQRMLRVRAMSWAMRDLFADALGGLAIREEVLDAPLVERDAEFTTLEDIGPKGSVSPPAAPEPSGGPNPSDAPDAQQEALRGPEDMPCGGMGLLPSGSPCPGCAECADSGNAWFSGE